MGKSINHVFIIHIDQGFSCIGRSIDYDSEQSYHVDVNDDEINSN